MKPSFTIFTLALALVTPSAAIPRLSKNNVVRRDLPEPASEGSFPAAGGNNGSSSSDQSAPILLPAVHWNFPVDDPRNLLPANSSDLYYSSNATSDPTVQHLFASVSATFQYDSVVLDHSSSVSSVSCDNSSISIVFTSQEMLTFASNSWTVLQEFVLVTSVSSCGASTDQFAFLLIESIQQINGTLSVLAIVREELVVGNAFGEMSLTWGMYYPPGTDNSTTLSPPNSTALSPPNATNSTPFTRRHHHGRHHFHRDRGVSQGPHDLHKRLSKDISVSADVDAAPADSDVSPWGPATSILSVDGNELFCVNCHFKGHLAIAGSASWSILHPTHINLNMGVDANLDVGFGLGLVGKAGFSKTANQSILTQDIPGLGFEIPEIFTVGVFVSIDATATLGIEADGEVLVETRLQVPDFHAVVDHNFGGGDDEDSAGASSVQSLTPQFTPTFNASGSITASARLGLPVGLNFGFKVAGLDKQSIALIEQPSLFGNITFSDNTPDGSCNDGIEFVIDAQNDVKLDLFGLKTFDLDHRESAALAQGCFPLSGPSAQPSDSTSSTADATPPSTDPAALTADPATSTADPVGVTTDATPSITDPAILPTDTLPSETPSSADTIVTSMPPLGFDSAVPTIIGLSSQDVNSTTTTALADIPTDASSSIPGFLIPSPTDGDFFGHVLTIASPTATPA